MPGDREAKRSQSMIAQNSGIMNAEGIRGGEIVGKGGSRGEEGFAAGDPSGLRRPREDEPPESGGGLRAEGDGLRHGLGEALGGSGLGLGGGLGDALGRADKREAQIGGVGHGGEGFGQAAKDGGARAREGGLEDEVDAFGVVRSGHEGKSIEDLADAFERAVVADGDKEEAMAIDGLRVLVAEDGVEEFPVAEASGQGEGMVAPLGAEEEMMGFGVRMLEDRCCEIGIVLRGGDDERLGEGGPAPSGLAVRADGGAGRVGEAIEGAAQGSGLSRKLIA